MLKLAILLCALALLVLAQAPPTTQWDVRGSTAPTSGCSSSQDVGKRYSRINAATPNGTLYVCQNTGVGTFGWGNPVGSGNVLSVFGRAGAVVAQTGDYSASQITGLAPIATSGSASDLSAGTVPTARLGSGVANSGTYLRGDQTWAAIAGSVASVTAGPTGALVISPTTGPVVADLDPAYINASSWTFTGAINAANAAATAPAKAGTTPPVSCAVGDQFFDTDAAAGSNLLGCTSVNTWTVLGGGGVAPPTYLWQDLCRVSASGWYNGFQNLNGTFQHSTVANDPACSIQYEISGSGDQGLVYMGDGGDKITRINGNWDFTFDAMPTAQNDKTVFFGVLQGTTRTNDGCYIRGQRVDSSTVYQLICRAGGVDGTPTNMTGNTITATRSRFRIRRVSGTVFASINGGTEFSTTSSVPTTANGAGPVIRWENAVGGASGTLYFYRFGMAY